MWSFKRKEGTGTLPVVELSPEEQEEISAMRRSFSQGEGGTFYTKREHVDSFERSIAGLSLMGRAERFLILGCSRPEYMKKACEAAAKACAIFPISIYFYDFACILDAAGEQSDARKMFAEFLRRFETEELGSVEQIIMRQRDVDEAVARARKELAKTI